ncbi:MAG: class I SAM-dependent methyltransferase [Planctomycetes bacterium]|nr:class I SAM-dependent methyltransferase [Planctomycetota bacterium]
MTRTTIYEAGSAGAEFYDLFHLPGKVPPITGDVAFYVRMARRARGPVLELACGTGRVTIPIAKAGVDIMGLDRAAAMLRIARTKAGDLPVRFLKGEMKRFNLRRKFALILIPFRSFQNLHTPAEQRECLRCARRHLAPGGRLVINLFDPRLEYCVHGHSEVMSRYRDAVDPVTGNVCQLTVRGRDNDALRQILTEQWRFTVRDKRGRLLRREDRVLSIRWTYRWEMAHLFELEGFKVEKCLGDFRGGPARHGAEQIWVVQTSKGGR